MPLFRPTRAVMHGTQQFSNTARYLGSLCILLALNACASNPQNGPLLHEQTHRTQPNSTVVSSATDVAISLEKTATAPEATPQVSLSRHDSTKDWEVLLAPLFYKARSLVSDYTNTDLSDIALHLANESSIAKEVGHETGRLIDQQFSNAGFADDFLNTIMRGQSGTYAALYSTRREEVMVSQLLLESYLAELPADASVQNAAIVALLVHELVHASDDKHYGIHDNRELNFRASFAQSATFEGHAQFVTRAICAQANCSSGLEALDRFMFNQNEAPNQSTQSEQAVSRNVLEYSYIEGERFISSLAKRPNGQALIEQVLRQPPTDPIQILDPKSYPNVQREAQNQRLLNASAAVQHTWLKAPWQSVQTSPLKGVNLRSDPAQRNAAIDGFTRLITAMVGIQLYDQSRYGGSPHEITLLSTESALTAQLFAETLHENTRLPGAQLSKKTVVLQDNMNNKQVNVTLHYTADTLENGQPYFTVVGVINNYVAQISGSDNSAAPFTDYINRVLLNLLYQRDFIQQSRMM